MNSIEQLLGLWDVLAAKLQAAKTQREKLVAAVVAGYPTLTPALSLEGRGSKAALPSPLSGRGVGGEGRNATANKSIVGSIVELTIFDIDRGRTWPKSITRGKKDRQS